MAVSDQILTHIQGLRVPQGDHAGKRVKLMPWQVRYLKGTFRRGVTTAAMTLPRANGKSSLAAFIASAYLWGPVAKDETSVIIVASSIQQGSEVFDQVLPQLPTDRSFKVWDSFNAREIEDKETGTTLRVLGNNPRHLHGLKAAIFICDEPAQWGPQREKMFSALRSATGKIKGCKLLSLGTMPEDTGHWFSKQVNGEADFAVKYQSRARKTWWSQGAMRKANPSYDYFPTLRADLNKQRDEGRRDEAAAARYRALNLNQGISEVPDSIDVLIQVKDYKRLQVESIEIQPGRYVLGLDPADGFSQFGVAAVSLDGDVDGFAAWPEVDNDLAQRSKKDGIDYAKWQRAGDLVLTSGPVTDIGEVIETAFSRWGKPVAIVCDLFRFRELRFILEKHGYSQDRGTLVTRRAAWGDGSEDYRAFTRAVKAEELAFRKSDALRDSFSQARTVSDSSGNVRQAKFHERSTRGRDDIAAACVFASGEVTRRKREVQGTEVPFMIHVPLRRRF